MTSGVLIQGGRVVDGSGSAPFIGDVRLHGDTITEVGPNLDAADDQIIDARGLIVAPGLIDLHTHVYAGLGLFSVDPAQVGLKTGVTTLLDTGSAGCLNFGPFYRFVMPEACEAIYALINIAQHGVQGHPDFDPYLGDLHELGHIHAANAVKCIERHRDRIVGVKARLSLELADRKPENERAAMTATIEAARAAAVPCMFHHVASSIPADELLAAMGPGDIVTHFYHGHGDGGFTGTDGAPCDALRRARDRGIIFDVGHGVGSFVWRVAEPACIQHGFWPDTISTDIHKFNIAGPVHDLPTTLSKFLYLGMPLEQVIKAATMNPAAAIGLGDRLGRLAPHMQADIAVMRLTTGHIDLTDVEGQVRTGTVRLEPVTTFQAGEKHHCK